MLMKRRGNVLRFMASLLSVFLLSLTDAEAAESASNLVPRPGFEASYASLRAREAIGIEGL